MFESIIERIRQKYRTAKYPVEQPTLPPHFKGRPCLSKDACIAIAGAPCTACYDACPTGAIHQKDATLSLDTGLCLFCGACVAACPGKAIRFSRDYRLASTSRASLIVHAQSDRNQDAAKTTTTTAFAGAPECAPDPEIQKLFARSFRLREISAAGCNACEADCNVLGTLVFDLPRFGIDFVASPRHADGILVTGPVPRNMLTGLQKCYAAVTPPKVVIAVGACAISGGLFKTADQHSLGVSPHLPVDLFIPGCPPHPYTILDGLLRFLGRIK